MGMKIYGSTVGTPMKPQAVIDSTEQAKQIADSAEHTKNKSNPHSVTKEQVGLGNVPNVTTDDQTPTHTNADALSELKSGETLKTAMGKIAKAIVELISHLANQNNPHSVTATQLGAVPTTRTVNGKALSANISLGASDVGASESKHNHTKSEITDFPTSMTPTAHNQSASTITYGMFAGMVGAGIGLQDPTAICLRNSTLSATDDYPIREGEICWQYE